MNTALNESHRNEQVRRDVFGIVSEFESAISEMSTETLNRINFKTWAELADRERIAAEGIPDEPF